MAFFKTCLACFARFKDSLPRCLHFGFTSTNISPFGAGDRSGWIMGSEALDGLPKIIDGTYTCWYKLPLDGGDTVVTEIIPNGIANKSMNINTNFEMNFKIMF